MKRLYRWRRLIVACLPEDLGESFWPEWLEVTLQQSAWPNPTPLNSILVSIKESALQPSLMPDKTALKYSLTNSNKYVWTYDLFLLVDIIQTIPHCIIHNANQYEQKPYQQADWLLKSSWKTKQKVMGRLQCCAINRAKVSLLLTCNPDKSNPCFSKAQGHSISLIQMKATKNTDTR